MTAFAPIPSQWGSGQDWQRTVAGTVNSMAGLLGGYVTLKAPGDGITDATDAIQKAVDEAAENGKAIYVPPGKYRTTAQITCASSVEVVGDGVQLTFGGSGSLSTPAEGSWFFFDHTGIGFYCADDDSPNTTKGLTRFQGIGTYRTQPTPGVGWAPTVCGADFHIAHRASLNDVFMLNPYIGVTVNTPGVLWVNGLKGQPLYTGIDVDFVTDIQNWQDIHFWPFWSQNSNVTSYTMNNTVGVRVARGDGIKVNRLFTWGHYRTVLAQDVSGDGSGFAAFSLNDVYSDKCGGSIEINSDFYAAFGTINGVYVNSDSAAGSSGPGIWISGSVASQINILGFQVARAHDQALLVEGAAHVVSCQPIKIEFWDRRSLSQYAFSAGNGATINLLSIPKYSTTTRQIEQVTSGVINFPAVYQYGTAAEIPFGICTSRATIADDGVTTITVPTTEQTVNLHLTPGSIPAAGNPAGSYWLRCSASPGSALIAATHTANVTVTTGVLTGTTGTDGNLTISAANDGKIYVENRTGTARSFIFTVVGR